MGQSQQMKEKAGFLTDLGIDRLHPEPKNDFLSPGAPKKAQNHQKYTQTSKIHDFGVGGLGRIVCQMFPFKGRPIRRWGVGSMGRSREMRRGNQPLPPTGVSDH